MNEENTSFSSHGYFRIEKDCKAETLTKWRDSVPECGQPCVFSLHPVLPSSGLILIPKGTHAYSEATWMFLFVWGPGRNLLPRAKPGLLCRTVCQWGSQQERESSPGCNCLHGRNAPGGVDTFQGTKGGWRGTQRLATGLGSPDSDKKVGCAVKFGFQKTVNSFLSYKRVSNITRT